MNQPSPKPQSAPEDHLIAFELYLAMGTGRSIKKLVEVMRVQTGQEHKYKKLEAWSSRHGWQARIKKAERESEAAGVAEYIAGAPLATAKALRAIGSVMNLAESLMNKAAANKDIEIKSVNDLAKVSKMIENCAKLGELLAGRASERVDQVVSIRPPDGYRSDEMRGITDGLAKLETRRIAELEAKTAQDVDSPPAADAASVIEAEYTFADQGDSEPVSRKGIMRHFEPETGKTGQDQGPPAVGETRH